MPVSGDIRPAWQPDWADMTPHELFSYLDMLFKEDPEDVVPPHIWGPPGVGKSDIVRQAAYKNFMPAVVEVKMPDADAQKLGKAVGKAIDVLKEEVKRKSEERRVFRLVGEDVFFKDVRLLLCDVTDVRGIPVVRGDMAVWVQPVFLPRPGYERPDGTVDLDRGVLFLDEMPSAPRLVQTAAHQLILKRRIGEYKLPEGWHVVAAGNPLGVGAIVHQMPSPLANRFIHINLVLSLDDWIEWAIAAHLEPELPAFHRSTGGEYLFNIRFYEEGRMAFPTPRSWEFVDRQLKMFKKRYRTIPPKEDSARTLLQKAIEGCVGPEVAGDFFGFLEYKDKMPDPLDVLDRSIMNPKDILHEDLGLLWAFYAQLQAVLANSKGKTLYRRFANFLKFVDQLDRDMAVVMVGDTVKVLKSRTRFSVQKVPGFERWAKDVARFVFPWWEL